ncbi:MAG: outer membrane protein assembly factor BamD [Smithellaceae bacterium]
MKLKNVSIILAFLLICSGCSFDQINKENILSFFKKSQPVKNTPEALYSRGTAEYQNGNYKKARSFYTRLKEEHPLHEMAILADLGIADSYFSDKEYIEAEAAYRDFTTFYPTNENVPYALYQMGMCHYLEVGAIDRDQTEVINARRAFERLVSRYPQSKFSILAEKMIRDCKTKIAEHEFYVGNFYFKQKKYAAALQRFETVARDYSGVGLDLKVESYIAETKKRLAEEEKVKQLKEEKAKAKSNAKAEAKAKEETKSETKADAESEAKAKTEAQDKKTATP